MELTLSGIVKIVRFVHERKALSPMEVTPFGIVMLARLVQSLKAVIPMEVTVLPSIVSGMVNDV